MPARKWSVWSLSPDGRNWLEVAEDIDQAEAEESAARRTRSAAKYDMHDARFVALPKGEVPDASHIDPPLGSTVPEPEPVEPQPFDLDATVEQLAQAAIPPGARVYVDRLIAEFKRVRSDLIEAKVKLGELGAGALISKDHQNKPREDT